MYGKISLKDYAGHANLPLPTVYVRQGSAATIGFLDVPDAATSVSFTAVNVAGVALTVAAAKVDGIWTATLPASHFAAAGNVENGITIKASDGTSEWSLGVGGLVVLSAEATPAPGETTTNVTDKTLDGEEMDTGTISGLREAVRKLGGALGATVTALALCVNAMPLQDIPVTNEVYTAAETDAAILTAIGSIPPPAPSMTTNAVCDIVTNEVATSWIYGEWVWTGAPDENPGPPVYHASAGLWTIPDIGDFYADIGKSVSAPANATSITWTIYFKSGEVSIMVGDVLGGNCELWMGEENMYTGPITNAFFHAGDYYQAESATVEQIEYGSGNFFTFYKFSPYPVTASRTATASSTRNALGLARENDLPNKMPVDEILLNGADGKVYHLRIGAGGSVDIYSIRR